jgi:FemAB-related protein (PEP-CTERM system-associated)
MQYIVKGNLFAGGGTELNAIQIPTTPARLSETLEQQARDVFYYQPAWLRLVAGVYGYAVNWLTTSTQDGRITGLLPVCTLASPLTGKRVVALPFSDHCPLLAEDEASANDLIDQAIRQAREQKARYLELRTGVNTVLARRADLAQSDLYVRWVLPLSSDAQTLWSALRKPVQRQIKKAQNQGVQVRLAERREEVEHYYRLHLQTRSKKHGMPAQPRRYFYALWDAFSAERRVQVLLAEYQGAVIAGMILLGSGAAIRYAYGASDEAFLHLAPNNLLMWKAIEWGCQQGYQTLDMGRTACDNEGLMEFKRRWGATQEPLPYYYYPQVAGLVSTSEQSRKFQLLTACWRHLPLQVAGSLGGRLYKHLG